MDLDNQSGVKKDCRLYPNVTKNRRSANYKPNIWKFDFLQTLTSQYDTKEFGIQLGRLVKKVKGLFDQEMGVLQKLELVDWIKKLGLANHFQKEIKETLETTLISMKSNNQCLHENLYVTALCLRLLRQHGFKISPDLLGNFVDEKGTLRKKHIFADDVKEIMELLQASYLSMEGECILEEAKNFAIISLKDAPSPRSINIRSNLVEKVVHALECPSHWRVLWFEVKWHIKQYENEKLINHDNLLELAKLNFNMIQANLQKEIKELSRWWENLEFQKCLNFARNRLVESFMCAAGVAFEPKYKALRKWLTKVVSLVLVIDDVYDIYGSFEELQHFTTAIDRWDTKEHEQLPAYMRIFLQALTDATVETAYEIAGEEKIDMVLPYLKKGWIDFCKALYVEAKWYKEGYIPSLQEYLSNASISSSGPVILLHAYFATVYEVTDNIDEFLQTNQDLVYNVSLIIRLCNDLGTTVAERERGDTASSILCYMNQMNVTEEEARKHVQDMIKTAWMKINGHCLTSVGSMGPFLTQATNAARVAHTLYQNGDGFGIQDRDIKRHILSLVVEPYLEV